MPVQPRLMADALHEAAIMALPGLQIKSPADA